MNIFAHHTLSHLSLKPSLLVVAAAAICIITLSITIKRGNK